MNNKDLTLEEKKWNKMWDLWVDRMIETPYAELMTYQSEINNGGHNQYFFNTENNEELNVILDVLMTSLPEEHKGNLRKAYQAYLEEDEDVLEECDNFYYSHEQSLQEILEERAKRIKIDLE